MNINLPPDQQAFVENLVESGRFASADDVIGECVRLLASREQLREQVNVGVEQADRGELIDHDTVFANLRTRAAEIQQASSGQ
jgi:antitoxin ParD1/3/4